jgi:hypothetical protein
VLPSGSGRSRGDRGNLWETWGGLGRGVCQVLFVNSLAQQLGQCFWPTGGRRAEGGKSLWVFQRIELANAAADTEERRLESSTGHPSQKECEP